MHKELYTYMEIRKLLTCYEMEPRGRITKLANRDLSVLGCYTDRLKVSVSYYFYGVYAKMYLAGIDVSRFNYVVEKWYKEDCNDTELIVRNGLDKAYNDYIKQLVDAEYNKKEPSFGVSRLFDYTILPKTMQYNDHLDMVKMISLIEKEFDKKYESKLDMG